MMEIREDPVAGRYYVAAQDLPAGSIVLSARPTAAALSDSQLKTHCSCCFQPCSDDGECNGCRALRFCKDCRDGRVEEVALHSPAECECLKTLFSTADLKVEESRTLRLFMRLLLLRAESRDDDENENENEDEDEDEDEDEEDFPRFRDLEELCCNSEDMPESRLTFFHNIVKQAKYLVPSQARIGMDEGVNLLASVYCNAHEILNPDGSDVDLGFGIFVRACLFNHSCDPNCVWFVGNDGSLCVRSLRPIKAGEALTITYWDLHEVTSIRRRRLEEEFHFVCKCTRCEGVGSQSTPRLGEGVDRALGAWKCRLGGKKGCEGMLEMPQKMGGKPLCSKCKKAGEIVHGAEDRIRKLLSDAKEKISKGDDDEAMRLLNEAAGGEGEGMGSTHALRLKIERMKLVVHSRRGEWKEGMLSSDAVIDGLRKVFGKEWLCGDLQYAYVLWQGVLARRALDAPHDETLLQARESLRVFATVLGSSHWHVRSLNSEVKKLTALSAPNGNTAKAKKI